MWTVSASLMFGSDSAGNSTSTTLPRTWTTFPVARVVGVAVALMVFLRMVLTCECFGAADDLQDLLGDRGLSRFVHLDRVLIDQLLGVVGGVVHRDELRRVERGVRLEHRRVQRELEVLRQQAPEHEL